MNTRRLLSLLVIAVLTLAPSFLLTGCESEDSPDTGGLDSYFSQHPYVSDPRYATGPRIVSISPEEATISFAGQQVVFTASGGRLNYTWDTSVHSKGTVVVRPGTKSAVYTAAAVGPNDVIVYDQDGHAALATINGPSSPLVATANPSEISVDGGLSVLTASGGVPPYDWTVGDIALGHVNPSSGGSVVYTRAFHGDNSVTVTDTSGSSYTIVITQPIPTP
jgi:hypothetical protein